MHTRMEIDLADSIKAAQDELVNVSVEEKACFMMQGMLHYTVYLFCNLVGLLKAVTQVPYSHSSQLHHLVTCITYTSELPGSPLIATTTRNELIFFCRNCHT